jgi:hypothetical protein
VLDQKDGKGNAIMTYAYDHQARVISTTDALSVVHLLWHANAQDDGESDNKLLGVYSTHERAARRRLAASSLEGFRDQPDAFLIDEYVLDADHWTEGFVTVTRGDAD